MQYTRIEKHYKEQIENFNMRKSAFEKELEDYNTQLKKINEEIVKAEKAKEENEIKLKRAFRKKLLQVRKKLTSAATA